MKGLPGYSVVLLIGVAIGFGLAQFQPSAVAVPPAADAATAVIAAPTISAPSAAPATSTPAPTKTTSPEPAEPQQQARPAAPALSDPAWQQSTVDESWLAFVEQQYPKRLQQDLSGFPDPVKQQMQAFQQTEVDTDWALATEQQLQDLLVTQQELKFLQVERVQCRQNGCELYGTSLKPAALDALNRQLRQFYSKDTNTMIMDMTLPGAEQGNFYLLLSGMKKD
ncbi:hypothetical protein [Rheinheimera texasensis]|uniref:hypothetical protein n=1 Tax=Rheinheimera texasensis TaxID=306205 RepID=UPI0004E1E5EB|nr:hypothetical protein [Rheinheimera texasensis]